MDAHSPKWFMMLTASYSYLGFVFNSVNPCIALLLLRHCERWLPCTVNTINVFYYVVWWSWSIVFCSFIVCRK